MIQIHDAANVWMQSQRNHAEDAVLDAVTDLAVSNGLQVLVAIIVENGAEAKRVVHVADPRKERGMENWVDGTLANIRNKNGYDAVGDCCLLLSVRRDGEISVETWSVKKRECARMSSWVETWIEPDYCAVPFRTLFGWGNGGVPQPLTRAEMASLNERQRRYAHAAMPQHIEGLNP